MIDTNVLGLMYERRIDYRMIDGIGHVGAAAKPIELLADLNAEDDDGLNWSSLSKALHPERIVPGAVVTAGRAGFRSRVEIVAVDGGAGQEVLQLRDAKGEVHSIALADVTDARLAFHWKP